MIYFIVSVCVCFGVCVCVCVCLCAGGGEVRPAEKAAWWEVGNEHKIDQEIPRDGGETGPSWQTADWTCWREGPLGGKTSCRPYTYTTKKLTLHLLRPKNGCFQVNNCLGAHRHTYVICGCVCGCVCVCVCVCVCCRVLRKTWGTW